MPKKQRKNFHRFSPTRPEGLRAIIGNFCALIVRIKRLNDLTHELMREWIPHRQHSSWIHFPLPYNNIHSIFSFRLWFFPGVSNFSTPFTLNDFHHCDKNRMESFRWKCVLWSHCRPLIERYLMKRKEIRQWLLRSVALSHCVVLVE